jgi:hypothetical protein
MRRVLVVVLGVSTVGVCFAEPPSFPKTKEEVIALREDVWAEAAIRQPGGPSYEFFRDLFPPLRYVNTAFRQYPIELSAPGAKVKARYVSNGSAINPKADKPPMWYDPKFGVEFFVGKKAEPFGADPDRLDGPRYAQGWLPIVQTAYKVGDATVEQEAFAPFQTNGESNGAVCVRFAVRGGVIGLAALVRAEGAREFLLGVQSKDGEALLLQDGTWQWNTDGKRPGLATAALPGKSNSFVILTKGSAIPNDPTKVQIMGGAEAYDSLRQDVVKEWKQLLARGVNLEVPEPIVQNAWRSMIVGNEMMAVGDRMHYSAGNAYDHLYEAECGDATLSLLLYGQTADARRMVGPLLAFNREATRFHVAGHKLQLLAHYYLVTRDAAYIKEKAPVWEKVVDVIVASRKTENGLLPKDRFAGDIDRNVYSLSSNSACWRGLRDMAVVLADIGQKDRAAELADEAKNYKAAILAAVAKSERHETTPPFIPIPLLGNEKAVDPITSTKLGSYYDLMAPYVLGSDIFAGTDRETWMIDYLRHHGGLAMGMIRSHSHDGQFAGEPGNNVLYGLRYMLTILRRDDRDHALAGFYGQLAQGMTRDTFIGGEGSKFFHGDARGRSFYLPPNSAANAMFLETLRYLLLQDWQDETGKPQELRLLYGAPGRWLADGQKVKFERAPTMFGPMSLRTESRLSQGEVLVDIDAPPRPAAKWTLRAPLPPGWKAVSASIDDKPVALGPDGVVDLTGKVGSFRVRYVVEKSGP